MNVRRALFIIWIVAAIIWGVVDFTWEVSEAELSDPALVAPWMEWKDHLVITVIFPGLVLILGWIVLKLGAWVVRRFKIERTVPAG